MAQQNSQGTAQVKEHVTAVLPFQVLEKIVDKPLRIRGVAICTGMSRNFNIYTPEELQAFSSKLADAPVYIEHVSVNSAVGKVTSAEWDGSSIWYEAEIYDDETAEKIRKGLIQHVSVGADYEAIDVVDGKVPHGLHNAELSLVAVPGVPETNVQVIEILENKQLQEKLSQADKQVSELQQKATEAAKAQEEAQAQLVEAKSTIEKLKTLVPGVDLLVDPPVLMSVSECLERLERVQLPKMLERLSLGNMVQAQKVRKEIFEVKQKYGVS
jgi:hypothetical protein